MFRETVVFLRSPCPVTGEHASLLLGFGTPGCGHQALLPVAPDVQRWNGVRKRWQTSLHRKVDGFKARGLNPTWPSFDSAIWAESGLPVPLFCTTELFTLLAQMPPLGLACYFKYHFIIGLVEVLVLQWFQIPTDSLDSPSLFIDSE